jgi:hypothetical protein
MDRLRSRNAGGAGECACLFAAHAIPARNKSLHDHGRRRARHQAQTKSVCERYENYSHLPIGISFRSPDGGRRRRGAIAAASKGGDDRGSD